VYSPRLDGQELSAKEKVDTAPQLWLANTRQSINDELGARSWGLESGQ
jgi:hypothetical protein